MIPITWKATITYPLRYDTDNLLSGNYSVSVHCVQTNERTEDQVSLGLHVQRKFSTEGRSSIGRQWKWTILVSIYIYMTVYIILFSNIYNVCSCGTTVSSYILVANHNCYNGCMYDTPINYNSTCIG